MSCLKSHKRAQVLARRDRHPALGDNPGMPRDIVRDHRLLEPGEIIGAESAGGADRQIGAPLHVGVRHERKAFAQVAAHGGHPLHVLGERGPADLHLDGAKAAREIGIGLPQQRIQRELQVDAAGVAGHLRIVAAQQAPQGRAGALRLQVPERHVDGGDRQHGRTAAAAIVQRPPQLLPQLLDPVGVLAGQDLGHLA